LAAHDINSKSDVPDNSISDSGNSHDVPDTSASAHDLKARPSIDQQFAQFWSVYPYQYGYIPARKRFLEMVKSGVHPEAIIEGVRKYITYREAMGPPHHWKEPAKWLTERGWEANYPTSAAAHATEPRKKSMSELNAERIEAYAKRYGIHPSTYRKPH
jgi:hypothetical protein